MADSNVGREIDGYHIREVVGRGGMGTVYKAEETALSRLVALKCLNPGLADDESFLDRFRTEARAIARVNSPYIVQIYTFSETEIGLVIVMEYVKGGTLRQRIHGGETDWKGSLPLIQQMLTALQHAHGAGVIHRDIKPQNILLSDIVLAHSTRVKMTDFGLAKVNTTGDPNRTVTQGVYGTLPYMSPEQVEGYGQVDHRTDIYSLGMTWYEMLAGRLPFDEEKSEYAIMRTIVEGDLPELSTFAPSVPDTLHDIVMTAVAKDPEERFQSAAEMQGAIGELEEYSDGMYPEQGWQTREANLEGPMQDPPTQVVLEDEAKKTDSRAPGLNSDILSSSYWRVAGGGMILAVTVFSGWYFAFGPGASPAQPQQGATAIAHKKGTIGDTSKDKGGSGGAAKGGIPRKAEFPQGSFQKRLQKQSVGGASAGKASASDKSPNANDTTQQSGQSVNEQTLEKQPVEQRAGTGQTDPDTGSAEARTTGAVDQEPTDSSETQQADRRNLPPPIDTLVHIEDPSVLYRQLEERVSKGQLIRGEGPADFFTPDACYIFVVEAGKVVAVLSPVTNGTRIELRSEERIDDWNSLAKGKFTIWVSLTN